VRSLYPDLADRVTVIANGVDRMRFSPGSPSAHLAARSRFDLPTTRPCALFVGGDWDRKGLAPAIRALADVDDWHLVVAGRGDEAAYRQLAIATDVADRVHFLGVVRDTPELYHAGDAFLLPTAYEAFPLAALEAAASGLPLIATAVSGIKDILVDGVTGFRVPADERQIALRLRQLSAEPTLGSRMGAAARRLTADYTWSAMVASHRTLYLHTSKGM